MYAHCNFGDCVSARYLLSLRACMTRRHFLWAFSIHVSFISFTKPELKTCVLLKTSLEVTSLLGMTVSCVLLRTSSEVTSVSRVTVFLVEVACSVWNTCVKGTGTEGACITGTCVGRAYIGSVCTGSTCAESACTGVASDEDVCIGSVCAVERSEIRLQSFRILEVGGAG